jgi:hypothetical protein
MRVRSCVYSVQRAQGKGRTTKGRRFGGLDVVGRLTRKAWLLIAAVVIVIVVAVVGCDDNPTDEAATGAPTDEPGTDSSPSTAGDTTAPTGGVTPTTAPLPTSECDDPVVEGEVLGRRDLDADGVDELFVKTGSGASTDIIGVFGVEDCRAVQATMGGSLAEFPVGAALRHIDGLQVSSNTLVVYTGTSTDGEAFDVAWRTLRLDSGTLTETGSDGGTAQRGDDLYRLASTFSP